MPKVTYLTESQYNELMNSFDTLYKACSGYLDRWDRISGLSDRVRAYSLGSYSINDINSSKVSEARKKLRAITDFQNYITKKYEEVRRIDHDYGTNDGGYDYSGSNPSSQGALPATIPTQENVDDIHIISATSLDSLTASQKTELRNKLKILGFTEDEIKDLMDGKISINKQLLEKFSKYFPDISMYKLPTPMLALSIEKVLGFSLYNKDRTPNLDRIALFILMAQKGLGKDIDLSEGSEFRKELEEEGKKLESILKYHPSVHLKILEKYGIDIFNEDGTVDIEKLALVKMMDSISKDDDYDLNDLLKKIPKTEPGMFTTPPSVSTTPTTPPVPTTPSSQAPTTPPTQPRTVPNNQPSPSPPPAEIPPQPAPVKQSIEPTPESTTQNRVANTANNQTINRRIVNAIAAGASFSKNAAVSIPKIPTPTVNKAVKTKGANMGVLAAAALVAGGSATGGGIMLGKKYKTIKFDSANWKSLKFDVQNTIERVMRNIGFSEEELTSLETSRFKIKADELYKHKTKIEKATKNSIDVEEALLSQYGYSIFNSSGSIDDYLLFITMIIDGKNYMDNYNIYNCIESEADFGYNGISMSDYIANSEREGLEEQTSKPKMNLSLSIPKTNNTINNQNSDSFEAYISPELTNDSVRSDTQSKINIIEEKQLPVENFETDEKDSPTIVVPPMAKNKHIEEMKTSMPKIVPPKIEKPNKVPEVQTTIPSTINIESDINDNSEKGFSLKDTSIPTIPPVTEPIREKSKYEDEEAPTEWLKNIGIY